MQPFSSMGGYNPTKGHDPGPAPNEPVPQNAAYSPIRGQDPGPSPPPGPSVMSGQWPTAAPTYSTALPQYSSLPVIAAPPIQQAQAPGVFYYSPYQQAPQPGVALAPASYSFVSPATFGSMSTALVPASTVLTQAAPPPASLPLNPMPGTYPTNYLTWHPPASAVALPSTNLQVNQGYSCLFPGEIVKIRILICTREPWTINDKEPIQFEALDVPASMTIKDFLAELRLPPERSIIYEVSEAGNGKWNKGLVVDGCVPEALKQTLKQVGWDASRSGKVGIPGHREELSLWLAVRV
ncbi:hypothetical protein B0T16DRAFT_408605 [Cercophora newfieldiana]|uniref:Uncharacterized protein n=1 Tax=Cercophora newfieldiana TaxID=92897 RepID=A0AA40CTP6_9PEZI|nr:hypothetical protein B0T16DRAFT_408605 [Cercophora newfieldiana]